MEALGSPSNGLRFFEVGGDNMEPTLRRRDYVLYAPISDYDGEGYYLFRTPIETATASFEWTGIYDCSGTFGRGLPRIRLVSHFKIYPERLVSRAEFQRTVAGKIVMFCNVKDPALLGLYRQQIAA